jgi:hypothetical protein
MLTNIHKNLVGFVFHNFVRKSYKYIFVKSGKSCLVRSAPGGNKVSFIVSRGSRTGGPDWAKLELKMLL